MATSDRQPVGVVVTVATAGGQGCQPSLDRLELIGPELGPEFEISWRSPEGQPSFGIQPASFAAESVVLVGLGMLAGGFIGQLGSAGADAFIAALKKLFRRTAEESARDVYRITQTQVVVVEHAGRSVAFKLVEGTMIEKGGDGELVEQLVEERLRELGLVGTEVLRELDERIAADDRSSDYTVTVLPSDTIAVERITDVEDLLRRVHR